MHMLTAAPLLMRVMLLLRALDPFLWNLQICSRNCFCSMRTSLLLLLLFMTLLQNGRPAAAAASAAATAAAC